MVIDDIMSDVKDLVPLDLLLATVFQLLDQTALHDSLPDNITLAEEIDDENKYDSYIKVILEGLTKVDAQIMIEYIFENSGKSSLSELSTKYGIPKSTLSKKIIDFKNKIFTTYMPENESDGECFIKKLAYSLDEMAN